MRDQIEDFEPAGDDIDYPGKLVSAAAAAAAEGGGGGATFTAWYPSLERTLACLSRIYLNVEMHIFEELAQEAVRQVP
jgi:hypothetical protein